jgi:hypothetical protein
VQLVERSWRAQLAECSWPSAAGVRSWPSAAGRAQLDERSWPRSAGRAQLAAISWPSANKKERPAAAGRPPYLPGLLNIHQPSHPAECVSSVPLRRLQVWRMYLNHCAVKQINRRDKILLRQPADIHRSFWLHFPYAPFVFFIRLCLPVYSHKPQPVSAACQLAAAFAPLQWQQ